MPDWVTGKLTVTGNGAHDLILSHCEKDENGDYTTDGDTGDRRFDFNTIVTMPKELDIIAGSVTDECMLLFINGMLEGCPAYEKYAELYKKYKCGKRFLLDNYPIQMSEEDFHSLTEKVLKFYHNTDKEPCFRTKADVYAYGKQALDNYATYGFANWYDWRVANWGTKSNACASIIHGNEVWFDTAWSPAIPVIKKLAELHPDMSFLYEYANEQRGEGVGWVELVNGKVPDEARYDNFSKEAYEQAFMLLGGREDYAFDKKTGTYKFLG